MSAEVFVTGRADLRVRRRFRHREGGPPCPPTFSSPGGRTSVSAEHVFARVVRHREGGPPCPPKFSSPGGRTSVSAEASSPEGGPPCPPKFSSPGGRTSVSAVKFCGRRRRRTDLRVRRRRGYCPPPFLNRLFKPFSRSLSSFSPTSFWNVLLILSLILFCALPSSSFNRLLITSWGAPPSFS